MNYKKKCFAIGMAISIVGAPLILSGCTGGFLSSKITECAQLEGTYWKCDVEYTLDLLVNLFKSQYSKDEIEQYEEAKRMIKIQDISFCYVRFDKDFYYIKMYSDTDGNEIGMPYACDGNRLKSFLGAEIGIIDDKGRLVMLNNLIPFPLTRCSENEYSDGIKNLNALMSEMDAHNGKKSTSNSNHVAPIEKITSDRDLNSEVDEEYMSNEKVSKNLYELKGIVDQMRPLLIKVKNGDVSYSKDIEALSKRCGEIETQLKSAKMTREQKEFYKEIIESIENSLK